jgi:hypothetical protein
MNDHDERDNDDDENHGDKEDGGDSPTLRSSMRAATSPVPQSRSAGRAAMAGGVRTAELTPAELYQVAQGAALAQWGAWTQPGGITGTAPKGSAPVTNRQ